MGKWVQLVDVRQSQCDVYLGRDCGQWRNQGWGNPWVIGRDGTRAQVLAQYERWFRARVERDPAYRRRVWGLLGQRLGCWCGGDPARCHGGVISRWLDEVLG